MHGDNNDTKLVEMFEKTSAQGTTKDTSQTQEINKFSEESQKLLEDMNQTEIFELRENSAKHHCLDWVAAGVHLATVLRVVS